ncbi:hypothetical protein Y032_0102g3440 [Ancylostoma ceylanicum]|nr:hypothetical protein Y032_0102g3440 [Ancylostoma ceylanicum]
MHTATYKAQASGDRRDCNGIHDDDEERNLCARRRRWGSSSTCRWLPVLVVSMKDPILCNQLFGDAITTQYVPNHLMWDAIEGSVDSVRRKAPLLNGEVNCVANAAVDNSLEELHGMGKQTNQAIAPTVSSSTRTSPGQNQNGAVLEIPAIYEATFENAS